MVRQAEEGKRTGNESRFGEWVEAYAPKPRNATGGKSAVHGWCRRDTRALKASGGAESTP